jgi:hypothetical protein
VRLSGIPKPEARKVERPPYDQLLREIEETSYLAVGRKYGVSDNAVRKWVRFYQRQAERETRLAVGEGDADVVALGASQRGDQRPLRLLIDADHNGAAAGPVGGHQLRIAGD